jgi:hypothetical protein
VEKAVFGIAKSEPQAVRIADALKAAGFSNNDISVLFPDKSGTRDFAHEQHTKAPEGAAAGLGTGAVIGGAFGWLVGIGALAIPGIGPFIAAGPIMAALAGAGVGAAAGGIAGALIGMGIPEYEAKRYEGKVKDGNILMSVHTRDGDERDRAKEIFKNGGAEDISYTGESTPSKPSRKDDMRVDAPVSTLAADEAGLRAGREYDRRAVKFSNGDDVEARAREAREAIDGPEGPELREAERIGKQHRKV